MVVESGTFTEALREQLGVGAETFGVVLDQAALDRFGAYLEELLAWNQTHNLTAIREPEGVVVRHFLDALSCTRGYDFTIGRPVIDVGTGAGFPGLPLKIVFPELPLTLLDSSIKKVEFLQHLAPELGFRDIDIIHARAEEIAHSGAHRQRFHLCLSRGVAPLAVLAELCLPFVSVGGYFLAQKNRDLGSELEGAAAAFETLGGGRVETVDVEVPGDPTPRTLVRVRKEEPTPARFPRRPGMPAKRPLTAETAGRKKTHPKYR